MTVEHSPDISEDAVRQQLDHLSLQLAREYADHATASEVADVVREEYSRFAQAQVRQYVPVLVGRAARSKLRRRRSPKPEPGPIAAAS